MQWNTYLVFPDSAQDFDPLTTHWLNRPTPKLLVQRGYFQDSKGYRVYCTKYYDISSYPMLGRLMAGYIRNYITESEYNSLQSDKSVSSINIFLDILKKKQFGMRIHKLNVNNTYTAVAVTYFDTAYSYENGIAQFYSYEKWKPNAVDRGGILSVHMGNLPNLSDFGYDTLAFVQGEVTLFEEIDKLDLFTSTYLNDYYEFLCMEDETIPSSLKPNIHKEMVDFQLRMEELLDNIDNTIKNLDVSSEFDTSTLSELITECNNGIKESLCKSAEQSSQLETIIGTVNELESEIEGTVSNSITDFSTRLDSISEFYGTRIFEIDELKVELSSFYDKAIAAWKESIESISESLTASAQAGSVALDINQALDSLKSNLKRVETLASIFDKASTVSGEISTNAQIVGTAVSTLSSLLLSFNESVNGYEKTLLSLVENVRKNLDLFLHSSDSVFREARKAVSDSITTNVISKGLDVINSLKKKETL